MVVEPVISARHAHGALAHSQQIWPQRLGPANGMPAAVQEKHAAPGRKTRGHQCVVTTKQIAPTEIRALEQVDFTHDEIRECADVFWLSLPDMAADRALHARQRHGGVALRTLFGGCFSLMRVAIEVDLLLQRTVHQTGCAEIQHHTIGLDDARKLLRIHCAKTTTNHLNEGRLVGARAKQHHTRRGCVVVALGEHRHIDHHLGAAGLKCFQPCLAFKGRQLAMDQHGRHTGGHKRLADTLRVGHGGTKHDGLAVCRFLLPVRNHGVSD